MHQNNERGAVTIFLLIIVLAMILLAGILIDASRIRTGKVQVKRAIESANKSVLAGYDYNLKEQFGIFALYENNTEMIEQKIETYITENLILKSKDKAKFLDLYDYKLEDLEITSIYNLTENEVTKNQIVEYMKYRAPKELINGFVDKVKALPDTGKITDLTQMKMDIDKLYMDINKYKSELGVKLEKINKFSYQVFKEEYINQYISLVNNYRQCFYKIKLLEKKLNQLNEDKKINALEIETTKIKLESLKNLLSQYLKQKVNRYETLYKYLDNLKIYNEEAKVLVDEIERCAKQSNSKINSLKSYLNEKIDNSSSKYLQQYKKELKDDISRIEKAFPKKEDIYASIIKLQGNKNNLNTILIKLEEFNKECIVNIEQKIHENTKQRFLVITQKLEEYKNDIYLDCEITKVNNETSIKDLRTEVKKIIKDKLDSKEEQESLLKSKYESLPSYKLNGVYPNKFISKDFSKEDEEYKKTHKTFDLNNSTNKTNSSINNSILDNFEDNVDFSEKSDFSKNAFNFVKNVCSVVEEKIKDSTLDFRNEVYINEYVIGTFNNTVPVLKNKTSTLNDLRGRPKDTNIKNEVEYILWGNTSETLNLNMVKSQILLLRFAIDTANVYRDVKKVEAAFAIATASSIWSFGLSAPFTQNLILCGWGMMDAVHDLDALMKGEEVPIFNKYEKKKSKVSKELKFSYHDYLRIFLLIQSPEQKMNRIEDLMQIKMGNKLSKYNTYIRVDATVSMKYLFITQAFIPKKFKIPDGTRHKFKIILYQGY